MKWNGKTKTAVKTDGCTMGQQNCYVGCQCYLFNVLLTTAVAITLKCIRDNGIMNICNNAHICVLDVMQ